jgi:hypothetical protein
LCKIALSKAGELRNDIMRKDWMLGFFGLFGIQGIPALLNGNWLQAIWIIWFVWFIYFIPRKQNPTDKKS